VSARGPVEYAVTRTAMSAYRSLAAAANVDLDVVVRHAANNTLSAVVDKVRRRDTLETRSPSAPRHRPGCVVGVLVPAPRVERVE
jgi:hypothetical protein